MPLAKELEEAMRVHQQNDTLKRSVADADELALRIHRNAGATTMKRCTEATQAHQKLVAQVQELETQYSKQGLHKFDPTLYLMDCNQKSPLSSLVKEGDVGSVDGVQRVVTGLEALLKRKQPPHSPLRPFLDEGIKSLDKAKTLLQETTLHSDQWATIPDSLLMLIGEVLEQSPASEIVEEHTETIKRMQFSADEISEQQQQAVIDGDMKLSETLYFKKVTIQEAMVEVFNKAFGLLDAHAAESFVAPLKRVHEVHNKVTSEMSEVMQKNDTLRSKVEEDLKNLKERHMKVQVEEQNISASYHNFLKQNDTELRDNLAKVEATFSSIAELERKLEQLGRDRSDAVQRRIRAVEHEAQRKAEVQAFETFFKQQSALLENTLHTAEVAEEVSDIFDELLCNGCNALEATLRNIDRDVEEQRQVLHETRLSHFRDLYLTLGDLQYKKERNLEELEKKIAHVHVQQELAMETFNPKAKEFSEVKKNLIKVKEEMSSQIEVLDQKGQLHIEAFKPTEVALIEAGKQFSHPVEELQKRNELRQQKLLEYHTLMSQEDETKAATHDDVEDELKRIEEERAKIQWRKPASAASSTRPNTSEHHQQVS